MADTSLQPDSVRFAKTARALAKYGMVVVPVFSNDDRRRKWENRIWDALDEMPEYRVRGKTVQRVLGGFGALGNPSSFHHPHIQRFRAKLKANVSMPLFRALLREAFGSVSKESWHRDVYDGPKFGRRPLPATIDGGTAPDELFGGWVNLSDRPTYFKAVVQTHVGEDAFAAQQRGGGFAALSKAETRAQRVDARLAMQANLQIGTARTNKEGLIVVPPGHQLIFFQRLLHAVAPSKGEKEPQLRLFVGHRLTEESVPLFPDLERLCADNAVPPIPSGQMPPMYSQNHYAFFQEHKKYQLWGGATFVPECLFARTVEKTGVTYYTPGSRDDRYKDANKKRYMPSLAAMGLPVYAYSEATMRTMTPEPL